MAGSRHRESTASVARGRWCGSFWRESRKDAHAYAEYSPVGRCWSSRPLCSSTSVLIVRVWDCAAAAIATDIHLPERGQLRRRRPSPLTGVGWVACATCLVLASVVCCSLSPPLAAEAFLWPSGDGNGGRCSKRSISSGSRSRSSSSSSSSSSGEQTGVADAGSRADVSNHVGDNDSSMPAVIIGDGIFGPSGSRTGRTPSSYGGDAFGKIGRRGKWQAVSASASFSSMWASFRRRRAAAADGGKSAFGRGASGASGVGGAASHGGGGGSTSWATQSVPSILCSELVTPFGFECREYEVKTPDGYLLSLQRISAHAAANGEDEQSQQQRWQRQRQQQQGQHQQKNRRAWHEVVQHEGSQPQKLPVLLQHGLLVGAESWLTNTPQQNLPFVLARAGYDVWLANSRCEPWSHGHVRPQPSSKRYWDWSWDELAMFDLPATVQAVLDATKAASLLYVGHSQGTLILLAALSSGALPADSIAAAYLMCPVAYLAHVTSPFVRDAAQIHFDRLVEETGVHRFSFRNEIGQRVIAEVCAHDSVNCSSLVAAITGPNCCVDMHRARAWVPWVPLSTSVKNMAHFAQGVRSGRWRMFDYGLLSNWWRYGRPDPPPYDPSRIPPCIPFTFAYGGADALASPPDVARLASALRRYPRLLSLPHYAHLDFLLGKSVKGDVYDDVVAFFGNIGGARSSSLERE